MASNRRRAQRKKEQPSLLDAIKNIVTAPFSWFSPTDYVEDANGKRRRLPSPLLPDQDELASPRVKRPRIDGPKAAYLDPPSYVFRRDQPVRSALGVSRTMSLDPPARPLRRESAIAQISSQRDLSMPPMPISARSSFLTRPSLTPQPSQPLVRESSEPPPLSSLAINPVFVRAPSSQPAEVQQRASAQTITLGSLADSTRSVRSPVRQHSSLLFSNTSPSIQSNTLRQQSPAEKALHELDIYKTPLLPTRLRSSNNITQSGVVAPDLFKSRRTQKLVLMQDDKSSIRLGVQAKKALANNTKPYAGEGGMKKLLARRKLEEIPEQDEHTQVAHISEKDSMEDDAGESATVMPISDHTMEKKDWFAVASNETRTAASVSSLRVGRDKKRNHIARPKATSYTRSKFSAAFDEDMDETMDDTAAVVDEDKKMEVSNDTFIFRPPPGFSFAKDNTTDAKELPISSLPFSLTKKTQDVASSSSKTGSPVIFPSLTVEHTSPKKQTEVICDVKPSSSDTGVPNFFAKSKILSKPIDVPAFPKTFKLTPDQGTLPSVSGKSLEPAPVLDPTVTPIDGPLTSVLNTKTSSQPQESSLSISAEFSPTTLDVGPTICSAAKQLETKEVTGAQISVVNVTEPNQVAGTTVSTDPSATVTFSSSTDLGTTTLPGVPDSKNTPVVDQGGKPIFSHIVAQTSSSSNALKLPVMDPPFSFTQPSSIVGTSKLESPPRGGFTFSRTASIPEKDKPRVSNEANFGFGTTQSEQKKALPPFSFGPSHSQTPLSTSSSLFSFGGGGSVGSDVSKPFVFGLGGATLPERPVTPPKVQDEEVLMDESPARDIQTTEPKPQVTLGFPFGSTPTASTLFGTQTSGNASSSSFSFGSTNAFSTPAKNAKPIEDKPISFAPASTFSFGRNTTFDATATASSPISLPAAAQPFAFGSNVPSFSFGAQPAPSSNPFGQTPTGSAPSSPATFGAPFSFGASPNTAFTFGSSQPASPTGGNNIALPQQPSSTGFNSANFGQSAPSSPFSASSPLTPSAPSGAFFTIGSAPISSPNAPRQIKKLPTRRGGAKR